MRGAEGPEHCIYLPFYKIKKEMVSKKIVFTIYLHIIQSMVFGIYWHNYSDVVREYHGFWNPRGSRVGVAGVRVRVGKFVPLQNPYPQQTGTGFRGFFPQVF